MAWGIRRRYCCTNVPARCPHALGDALFSQAQFDRWNGTCRGDADRLGCGAALQTGRADNRRPLWVVASVAAAGLCAGAAVLLRTVVFPPPLEDIGFVASRTTVADTASEVVVSLRRGGGSQTPARLQARFVDGSARSGVDYLAPASTLDFPRGQDQLEIHIPVLRDGNLRRDERHFSVVLDNVLGRPSHTVVIAPPAADPGGRVVLEQSLLSASRIAADIAGLVVKIETMERLLSEFRSDNARFEEMRRQQRSAADNLVRAREAYLRAVQELKALPPRTVLATADRLAVDLRERRFKQQADTLPVLSRHLEELLKGKSPDMDRWVTELGATVPRVPGGNVRSPNV